MAQYTYPGYGEVVPYDYENITVSNSSIGFTAAKITVSDAALNFPRARRAKTAFVTVEAQSVRVRWDGGAPVGGSSGHLLAPGDSIEFTGENTIQKVRFIREAAVDATIRVTYGRTA